MNDRRDSEVRMIPLDRITIVNPRERGKRKFKQIVENIATLGLKKPNAASDEEWPHVGPLKPPFTSIVAVPSLFLPTQGDMGKVRFSAARVGANALLVFARSTRMYSWNNGLANLYLLFPVGFLLPAK